VLDLCRTIVYSFRIAKARCRSPQTTPRLSETPLAKENFLASVPQIEIVSHPTSAAHKIVKAIVRGVGVRGDHGRALPHRGRSAAVMAGRPQGVPPRRRDHRALSCVTTTGASVPPPLEEHHVISLAEQIAEAQRELAWRKKGYPEWVKSGKLDAGDAKYQIL